MQARLVKIFAGTDERLALVVQDQDNAAAMITMCPLATKPNPPNVCHSPTMLAFATRGQNKIHTGPWPHDDRIGKTVRHMQNTIPWLADAGQVKHQDGDKVKQMARTWLETTGDPQMLVGRPNPPDSYPDTSLVALRREKDITIYDVGKLSRTSKPVAVQFLDNPGDVATFSVIRNQYAEHGLHKNINMPIQLAGPALVVWPRLIDALAAGLESQHRVQPAQTSRVAKRRSWRPIA